MARAGNERVYGDRCTRRRKEYSLRRFPLRRVQIGIESAGARYGYEATTLLRTSDGWAGLQDELDESRSHGTRAGSNWVKSKGGDIRWT